jgi:hypothetical protein
LYEERIRTDRNLFVSDICSTETEASVERSSFAGAVELLAGSDVLPVKEANLRGVSKHWRRNPH